MIAQNRIAVAAHSVANGPGMPVFLYLRKSNKTKSKSRDETVSIQQQRKELREWCESRGWIVICEFVDDGKSASKNDRKRIEFKRMLAALPKGEALAICVWDLSRLTRKNSVVAGEAATVLMQNRVIVASLREGEINLNESIGRTIWNLHCEGNSEFAQKISAGVIRGRGDALSRARWPHGKIPYGYDRVYLDGETVVQTLHRNESAGKARHWTTRPVPNATEAPIAAKIIQDYAERDISIRGIAADLTRRGIAAPSGRKEWNNGHIRDILRCPVYCGDFGVGYSYGWKRSYEALANSPKETASDVCEAIVDRETWIRANEKLASNKDGRRVHAGKASALSGVVYCGHCGYAMSKSLKRGVVRYCCATAAKNPNNPTCKQWSVREADILPRMTAKLVESLDGAVIESLQAKPPEAEAAQLESLRRQEADLSAQTKTASRNLALCSRENYADVEAVLSELKTELDKVKNTIRVITTAADRTELNRVADWWRSSRDKLITARAGNCVVSPPSLDPKTGKVRTLIFQGGEARPLIPPIKAEPDIFRGLLKQLGARLTLHFSPKPKTANKQFYAVEWGKLTASINVHSLSVTQPAARPARTARPCGRK